MSCFFCVFFFGGGVREQALMRNKNSCRYMHVLYLLGEVDY